MYDSLNGDVKFYIMENFIFVKLMNIFQFRWFNTYSFVKLEIFQVVKHAGSDQLLLITRMMQGSMQASSHFSSHPAAAGTFFTLLLLGLKLCDRLRENGYCTVTFGANLLHDQIYRFANPCQYYSCK